MRVIIKLNFLLLCLAGLLLAQSASSSAKDSKDKYVTRKRGELVFEKGIIIEGRVEKPQVIIVIAKEKIKLEPITFRNSFLNHVVRPLRINTFELFTGKALKEEDIQRKSRRNQ
jgi:hypothetical protein